MPGSAHLRYRHYVALLCAVLVSLWVPNKSQDADGSVATTDGAGDTAVAKPLPRQQSDLTLYPHSQAGGALPSSLPFWEVIAKPAGAQLNQADVIAANRWLCNVAGGEQGHEFECSAPAFQFQDVAQLDSLRSHGDAMKSIFRTPTVVKVEGPRRGVVQVVALGLEERWGEWGEAWNREVSATQAYLRVFLPRPRTQVQVDFMVGTEAMQFECDGCYAHALPLPRETRLLNQILDLWHSECTARTCIKAHVVVVDDADLSTAVELLHTLAAPMWGDKSSEEQRAVFRETCGDPITASPLQRFVHDASSAAQSAIVAVQHPNQASSSQGFADGGVRYARSGCDVLRLRYNTLLKSRWTPEKRRTYLPHEQRVVDFLSGPVYQSMMKGLDTEDLLLRAYRRRLGMEAEPPKKLLLDAPLDHLDALLDAVQKAAAEDAKAVAYYASLATIATYAVDKFVWPGLYVGEKFALTMSFALAVPLIACACIACACAMICPRIPRFGGGGGGGGGKEGGKGAVLRIEDGEEEAGGEAMEAAKKRLMTRTKQDMQDIAWTRGIFLSPHKTREAEQDFFRHTKKEYLADLLLRKNGALLKEILDDHARGSQDRSAKSSSSSGGGAGTSAFVEKLGRAATKKTSSSSSSSAREKAVVQKASRSRGRDGAGEEAEGQGQQKRRRKTEAERLREDLPEEPEVHIGSQNRGTVKVTIMSSVRATPVKGQVRYDEKLEGLLNKTMTALGGGRLKFRFFDGENNEVRADTRPFDLLMEDEELLEARPEPLSPPPSKQKAAKRSAFAPDDDGEERGTTAADRRQGGKAAKTATAGRRSSVAKPRAATPKRGAKRRNEEEMEDGEEGREKRREEAKALSKRSRRSSRVAAVGSTRVSL